MSVPARQPEPLGKAFAGSTSAADSVAELTGVPEQALPRDAAHWAAKVARLKADPASPAKADNVTGRRLTGPVQGFGSMWQKTYTVEIGSEVTPQEAIAAWKADFGRFWPKGAVFHGALSGISPGDVALMDLSVPGGARISTGVMVLYADDESFTLMTPQGHMFAGWITNSAYVRDGVTVLQSQVLMRANDPLYEVGLLMGGHKQEDAFWHQTLDSLAAHLGTVATNHETKNVCVDKGRQWRRAGNIWHNAAIRSTLQMLASPFRSGKRRQAT